MSVRACRIWHPRGLPAKPTSLDSDGVGDRLRQALEAILWASAEAVMDPSLREQLLRIYAETTTIAVVGASGTPPSRRTRSRATCSTRATASSR
jgi:hypothetical protein